MNHDNVKRAKLATASLMFAVELTITMIDEVEKTCIYRHGVKQACNNLKKLLELDLDKGYFQILQQDENLVMGISDKLKELAHQMAKLNIGDLCAISESIPEIISRENNVRLKQLSA